mmetsp:Transcript_23722/g.35135  ORF Transcript_23722/g.35135 Transcript_23722/m.35135 type:complete len:259 (-) Transcript_23722:99-875(-)
MRTINDKARSSFGDVMSHGTEGCHSTHCESCQTSHGEMLSVTFSEVLLQLSVDFITAQGSSEQRGITVSILCQDGRSFGHQFSVGHGLRESIRDFRNRSCIWQSTGLLSRWLAFLHCYCWWLGFHVQTVDSTSNRTHGIPGCVHDPFRRVGTSTDATVLCCCLRLCFGCFDRSCLGALSNRHDIVALYNLRTNLTTNQVEFEQDEETPCDNEPKSDFEKVKVDLHPDCLFGNNRVHGFTKERKGHDCERERERERLIS